MSVGKWKIWVTGATGQIDAALVHLLVGESNAEVVMAARSPRPEASSCRWTRDHYWIYHERRTAPILADDTGLGIERTRSLLIFTVISQTRSEPQKLAFYEVL